MKERRKDYIKRNKILITFTLVFFLGGIFVLWIASLRIPSLEDLSVRKVSQSTKIYDRTGEVLLYDLAEGVRRDIIPFEEISEYSKNATIAIEDKNFYTHGGIKLSSFFRAMLVNLSTLSFSQGGSTITQQVVKNSILTKDKTPTRKLKEWILALKLEKALTKDEILNLYLNEIPYGGTIYGIEEASKNFFGKQAKDVNLAEAAYLAAIPKAPTFYSPYGSHRDRLDERKNLVLKEMLDQGMITQEEHDAAVNEKIVFKPRENTGGIRAPHFVFYVIDYLAEKYGEDAIRNSGFKVITTIDYDIQAAAEATAKKYGTINEQNFNGENNAFVVIDPKTGDILAMVGSRDYFDDQIEGNFNVAIAHRQPGSAFKPIVYAELFNKGYTTETTLFDVATQFSTACARDNFTSEGNCYSPRNYDDKYRGPMSIRNALAQSINVPAVKALYLAGVKDSLALAQDMGIESLEEASRYGLTLVLGGGEVSLLDMTSAYGVFANDGMRNSHHPILRVEDSEGEVLEENVSYPKQVLPENTARQISSILSDSVARAPLYPVNSAINVPGRRIAAKTGTTNDYRDAWIIGYTPSIVIGAWVGNNNNSPMERKVSGLIVVPMWRELIDKIIAKIPDESFPSPDPIDPNLKPILRGEWRGGGATEVRDQYGQIIGYQYSGGVHSILHWVNKDDPRGPAPSNPSNDSQYSYWEFGVQRWAGSSGGSTFVPVQVQPQVPVYPTEPVTPSYPVYPEQPINQVPQDTTNSTVTSPDQPQTVPQSF